MAKNTICKTINTKCNNGASQSKHYGDSSFVAKKNQEARETLQKFLLPDKYAK